MIPAVLMCVIVSACADQQPTGPQLTHVARNVSDLPFNKFFVAWSRNYTSSPIETQLFALDARQVRQYAEFIADPGVLSFARSNPGRIYINGDEPDQYCVTPDDYASMYHDFVANLREADPTARVSPAGFAEPNDHCCPTPIAEDAVCPDRVSMHSLSYAEQFYSAYVRRYGVAPPVYEWRFHDFGTTVATGDINAWWARIDKYAAWSVAHGANMVLGTWGFIGWSEPEPVFQEHMKQAIGRIMSDKRINGAVYWSIDETMIYSTHYLVNGDGSLTPYGRTFVNPLTDIPAGVEIVGSGNGEAQLRWGNTTSAWAAEAEFWVQAPGSNSFVYRKTELVAGPGGAQTALVAFNGGESVKGRVRYYNAYGQAAWSSFSNVVSMPASDPKADQKRVFRKSPFFCLVQSC